MSTTSGGRIHVIGGPGSGKTTLARRLAARLGVPAYDLDDVQLKDGTGPRFRPHRPLTERLQAVQEIAAEPGWVTEGTYLWWTDELLRAADLVVWLDIPWWIALRRIFVRHVREYLAEVRGQHGLRELLYTLRYPHVRHLVAFYPWAHAYYRASVRIPAMSPADVDDIYTLNRSATAHVLQRYADKVIRCRRSAELAALVPGITEQTGSLAFVGCSGIPRTLEALSEQFVTS